MVVGGSNFHILVDMSGSGVMVSQSGQRSLWSDMPQVISSGILLNISAKHRRLQVSGVTVTLGSGYCVNTTTL